MNLLLESRRAIEKNIELRYAIKFCTELNKSLADTHQMVREAYGDSALSYSRVSRWLKLFQNGREEMEDGPRSGRPSTSKHEKIESENYAQSIPRRQGWGSSQRNRTSGENSQLHLLCGNVRQKKDRLLSKRDHRYLVTASLYYFQPHRSARPEIPGQAQLDNFAPASIQSWSVSDFFVPEDDDHPFEGARFENIEAIQTVMTKASNKVHRRQKCMNVQGKYFGDFKCL